MSDKDEALRLETEADNLFARLQFFAETNFHHGGSGRREAMVSLEGIESDLEKLKERIEQLAMDWTAQFDVPHVVTVQHFDSRALARVQTENINYGVYALYLWVLPLPD